MGKFYTLCSKCLIIYPSFNFLAKYPPLHRIEFGINRVLSCLPATSGQVGLASDWSTIYSFLLVRSPSCSSRTWRPGSSDTTRTRSCSGAYMQIKKPPSLHLKFVSWLMIGRQLSSQGPGPVSTCLVDSHLVSRSVTEAAHCTSQATGQS